MGSPAPDLKPAGPPSCRAKFKILTLSPFPGGGGNVTAIPVCPPMGDEGTSHENRAFWTATPSGRLELWIQNAYGYSFFEETGVDGEFYLDFSRP